MVEVIPGEVAFAGYAAVFDVVDRAGDVVRRGAFAGAGVVPLLWQHHGGAVGLLASVREDARGLRVEGVVEDPELARLVRGGAVAGLSVGYRALSVRQGVRRELLEVTLVEVSLVAVPMQALARVEVVA
ncbi:HK97 family phage prohead protease [Sphingomonas faeni]|uniref:HK97 family phage prohead protease n=1 Tax=Sphingomonas faeni TaxID=185950 RepID=UPI0027816322|nr:HK97 family phage prohead protease [Sphingomonas faeni]MDQ0839540.1 HK97 family phage prohead protease [Sphingomonas faeni]